MNTDEIKARLADENPDAILWDGLDDALVGVARRCGQPTLAVYDYFRCVAAYRLTGMTYEDAVEWIEFNVVGGWLGPNTPIMLVREAL
jgi:hypothetical protein